MTNNAILLAVYRQLINRMHLLRRRSFSAGSATSHSEHRAILAALASRNPSAAASAMRGHVEKGFERMQAASAIEQEEGPIRQKRSHRASLILQKNDDRAPALLRGVSRARAPRRPIV
jgi:FCD domain